LRRRHQTPRRSRSQRTPAVHFGNTPLPIAVSRAPSRVAVAGRPDCAEAPHGRRPTRPIRAHPDRERATPLTTGPQRDPNIVLKEPAWNARRHCVRRQDSSRLRYGLRSRTCSAQRSRGRGLVRQLRRDCVRVVTASIDKTARVWDISTVPKGNILQVTCALLKRHEDPVSLKGVTDYPFEEIDPPVARPHGRAFGDQRCNKRVPQREV
jgi:hypothetical protein